MAKQVKYRRGTTTQHTTFVGVDGEMTVDTDGHVVVVHDGSRAGGWPMANAVAVNTQIASLQANAGAQGDSIAVLYANAAIHYQLITQLSSNAATQQQSINQFLLTANAETITASFNAINANVTAANLKIESLTTANLIQFENIVTLQSNIANIESQLDGIIIGTGFATVAYVDEAIGNIDVGSSSQLINGNATASLGTDGLLTVSGRVVSEEIEGVANTLNIYSDWAKDTGVSIISETGTESVTLTSDRIVAVVANVGPLQKQWIFETDGDLLLPSGGDIKDAGTGLSVLGGSISVTTPDDTEVTGVTALVITGAGVTASSAGNAVTLDIAGGNANTGNFTFDGNTASVPVDTTLTLTAFNATTKESKLTLSTATKSTLYAGNNLELGVGYGTGFEQYWQFGATGSLTFPDSSIQSTAWTGNIPAPTVTQDIASDGAMSIMLYDGTIKYNNYATVEASSGNITGGNILTSGLISATGNVNAAQYNFANGVNILSTVGAGAYGNTQVASYLLNFDGDIEFTSSTAKIGNVDVITVMDSIRSPAYQFSNGTSIFDGITGGASALDDLSDVVTSSPTVGDVLYYNGTNWAKQNGPTIRWSLSASGTADYVFTGPGFYASTNDPLLYLHRGTTYIFVNTVHDSHPLEIRVSNGGAAYASGVSGVGTATITFTVPMDAPSTLYYQCEVHSSMGNTINVVT